MEPCDSRKFLEQILKHAPQALFDQSFYRQQGYETQLSVLPPNVRPDNNSNYTIIQIVAGVKEWRKEERRVVSVLHMV